MSVNKKADSDVEAINRVTTAAGDINDNDDIDNNAAAAAAADDDDMMMGRRRRRKRRRRRRRRRIMVVVVMVVVIVMQSGLQLCSELRRHNRVYCFINHKNPPVSLRLRFWLRSW
ncbi:hypothetical protein PoB_003773300 [Plakobranchus ocellatus]|uniref:Uncharacterized protein n=1 Tax=Plakobranchus ocellatus TaxID=259542 RepID=A0AAV4AV32_9GAST|nr:hypothetical protein PoB_003773300 [Plakobranchus ocellatus]